MKALFVGGRLNKELIDVEELVNLPEFSGRYTETATEKAKRISELAKKGIYFYFCNAPRAELCGQPIMNGYLGPMLDGDKIRYETQEVYDLLSM